MPSGPLTLPPELVRAVETQSAVLFLGAAASYGAHHPRGESIPSPDRLRDALSDRFLGGDLKTKSLAAVAEYAINESSIIAVQQHVRDMFKDFQPADFHRLIPRFRWHGIVSTNYDLLIERAYDPAHAPLQQLVRFVKNGQPVETEMKAAVDGVQYLKLHGCIDHYLDAEIPFILAVEQYVRYSTNRTRLLSRFEDWGREFPIIFCGYSISDPHVQNILFNLIDLDQRRPMFYVVDPASSDREERYWLSKRVMTVKATFEEFLRLLDSTASPTARALPRTIGGGTSTLRSHYKVVNAPETDALFFFLSQDVEHIRPEMPVQPASAKDFYRGMDDGWGAIQQELDVSRSVTDSLVVDAILSSESEKSGKVELYAIKGPAGNGKTIVLKRAAWMAATDYEKIVLFVRPGGTIRPDVIEEIFRYTQDRIFLFIDKAAFYVDEIHELVRQAKARGTLLTLIVAERDAEWNVRCESLDRYGVRDFPVRYLSEQEIRMLLKKLEQHDSLGLLKELPKFEDRVERLMGGAQRQLLVALHEATLGRAFEDIVFEEYQRIIPTEAQVLYLDICTLHRLGVSVRAGLINRVSTIGFVDFEQRLFKPLQHIVSAYLDKYVGDWVYTARHQHVAEMVFERVLPEPESKYDQLIRILHGMNLDYSSDKTAFSQLVRGHWVSEALNSRELGRSFFDAAQKVAPREAFLFQQRAVFEMEEGGDLTLAEKYIDQALSFEPRNRSFQHSSAVLARKQALEATNPLLRQRLRERARERIAPLLSTAETSYSHHTAAQLALDELREILEAIKAEPSALVEKRIVEIAKDFERYVQEGLQKFPLNEHLLALESDYHRLVDRYGPAEAALRKAFIANPRQDWIAIRLARTLEQGGKSEEAKQVLVRCVQENPTSKRIHFELAQFYMKRQEEKEKEFILDHLRRSFTVGDQNYEAQFWYARELFLTGRLTEAKDLFQSLRSAPLPLLIRTQARGIITDSSGRTRVFVGEVSSAEDAFMFVKSVDFIDEIFVHRSRARDEDWRYFQRGSKVTFTVGFNVRGPTAASVRRLE